jgi:hypothetical protein
MRHQQLLANLGLVLALGAAMSAADQEGVIRREEPPAPSREIERTSVTYAGAWRPAGANSATRVIGTVIDILEMPVPKARVQLRNLDTGNVEAKLESDDRGEYEFTVDESGTYVVEVVQVDGYIVALSNAGVLPRFETLQTLVQLPGRWDFDRNTLTSDRSVSAFFGMSSRTTMTATTIQIAVEQAVAPADPGVPVSPSTPSS